MFIHEIVEYSEYYSCVILTLTLWIHHSNIFSLPFSWCLFFFFFAARLLLIDLKFLILRHWCFKY